jgi:hypothetical protein
MTDATNVVPFERPRPEPPAFDHVEIRLGQNFNVTLSAIDTAGDVVLFEFALVSPAKASDLERLQSAWAAWRDRDTSAPAS